MEKKPRRVNVIFKEKAWKFVKTHKSVVYACFTAHMPISKDAQSQASFGKQRCAFDIFACLQSGQFVGIRLLRANQSRSLDTQIFAYQIAYAGGIAIEARNLEELKMKFERMNVC